ncbi:hypothetical protein COB72_09620 [bacterium]|nr:MAG: hypothetical protein COB72_09620 [bacterium]
MKRVELVAVIDRLRDESIEDEERVLLLGMVHFQAAVGHMASVSIGVLVGQSMRCACLIVRRLGAIDAEAARRFRQGEHVLATIWVMIGCFVILMLGLWILASVEHALPATSSLPMVMWSVFGLVAVCGYVFFLRMLARPKLLAKERMKTNTRNIAGAMMCDQRFRPWCIGCGYELGGLESALGDELWVGPAVCPECGQEYPAVGE